jgi:hypothetical protein
MRVEFKCELDSIQENIILYNFEELCKYSYFRINIDTDDDISFEFCSDVYTTHLNQIENFVNRFLQNEEVSISFNSNSGSLMSYIPSRNLIYFNVFTWKEGTTTDIDFTIKLNSSERYNLFADIFTKLLNFKRAFDNIEVRDYETSDIENYSDEEPAEDVVIENQQQRV